MFDTSQVVWFHLALRSIKLEHEPARTSTRTPNATANSSSVSDKLHLISMSSICETGVLPGRPDIEGIGTRVATYAQLLLSIFTIAFSPDASSFDSWWAILVTSLGLQFAAVAQRNGLTLFHALVVTWLAFPVFAMSWVYIFLHWRSDAMPAEILLATHIHGLVFLGFGLWIWSTAGSFGACPELNGPTQFVLFGKSLSPVGWVRIFVLVLYSLWSIMFLFAALAAVLNTIPPARRRAIRRLDRLFVIFSPEVTSISTYIPSKTLALALVTIFNLLVLALSIWSVEVLLSRNVQGISRAEDEQWTFGQIAALILLVGPLFTFARLIRRTVWGRRSGDYVGRQDAASGDLTEGRTGTQVANDKAREKSREEDYPPGGYQDY